MSGGIYGGDDVGAIVFDLGSHSFRFGFGGEEYPKFDEPSVVGERVEAALGDGTMEVDKENGASDNKRKHFLGTTEVNVPRENGEVKKFVNDCMIEDWDLFEKMLDYAYSKCLISDSKNHGVLFSETPWNVKDKREKLAELMFEKYQVPSFFLIKNAVLSAFSTGRHTALVLDSGATYTSATPVYEGYPITSAVVKSPVGGDMIVDQCRRTLAEQNIDLVPYYKVAAKTEVKDGEPPVWEARKNLPPTTKSYEDYMEGLLLEDFAHSTLQLCETPIDVDFMEKLPASSYGFPCGFRKDFLAERAKIPESLFDFKYLIRTRRTEKKHLLGHFKSCNHFLRYQLYTHILAVGGNSMIMGFTERLNYELAQNVNSTVKLRLPPIQPNERKYSSWIGGSIVSSLGAFQQLWIGKSEYEEMGKSIVDKRCA
ncbi:actin [Aphelenchoides bicaudatus]|nr:actin [Aphelenchoides bicaudatus]